MAAPGCRARIEDAEGNLLGTGIAGPAALRIGVDRALAEVEKACRAALDDAGLDADALSSVHAAVGLAGVGRKGALEELVLRPHPFRSVIYAHDATIACIGAHGARDGGIVIVGTGSVGFAVVGGREVRIGGYGFPISDEGSGADLGLHAIRMALRAYDERAVGTSLTRDVMMRFHNDPFEAVAWMDHGDWPRTMRHSRRWSCAMRTAGDPVARRIVRDAAEQIDELVRRLCECGASAHCLAGRARDRRCSRGWRRMSSAGWFRSRAMQWMAPCISPGVPP